MHYKTTLQRFQGFSNYNKLSSQKEVQEWLGHLTQHEWSTEHSIKRGKGGQERCSETYGIELIKSL